MHSLLSVGEICSGDRAGFPFLMAVNCSPSCIVTDDAYVTFGGGELLAYHSFCWKTAKPIPNPENPEVAGSVLFFVNEHSTDTQHRASAVTMHDGEQLTAIKNGKLARSPEQISPTDKSECKFWKSTKFRSYTALKRSKVPLRRFDYLYRSQYSDMSWQSIHILVGSIDLFFDDSLLAEQ